MHNMAVGSLPYGGSIRRFLYLRIQVADESFVAFFSLVRAKDQKAEGTRQTKLTAKVTGPSKAVGRITKRLRWPSQIVHEAD